MYVRVARKSNAIVRGTTKVRELSSKVQERGLELHEHVTRREEEYVGKKMVKIDVDGRRRK